MHEHEFHREDSTSPSLLSEVAHLRTNYNIAMAAIQASKRSREQGSGARAPPTKKFKRQTYYSSGSSSESENERFRARDTTRPTKSEWPSKPLATSDSQLKRPHHNASPSLKDEIPGPTIGKDGGDTETENSDKGSDSDSDSESVSSNASTSNASTSNSRPARTKPKRHDPDAFANSLTAILSSKLSTNKRVDPVLSRSKEALATSDALADSKLEAKAKRRMKEEKRLASEKGRVRDVLLGDRTDEGRIGAEDGDSTGPSVAEIAMQEKRLRKTAQRGVVKLFNAVRAAQVKGEEEDRRVRESGYVGSKRKEEKVGEMGRNAFLELVAGGGEAR